MTECRHIDQALEWVGWVRWPDESVQTTEPSYWPIFLCGGCSKYCRCTFFNRSIMFTKLSTDKWRFFDGAEIQL